MTDEIKRDEDDPAPDGREQLANEPDLELNDEDQQDVQGGGTFPTRAAPGGTY